MKNAVLWGVQVTVDYSFYVGAKISEIANEWKDNIDLIPNEENRKFLSAMVKTGQSRDEKLRLESDKEADRLREDLKKRGFKEEAHVAGNPGISAIRGHYLASGARGPALLPVVRYVGLYPDSLQEFVATSDERKELEHVFRGGRYAPIGARPQTVSLEGERYKLILGFAKGLTADYLVGDDHDRVKLDKKKPRAGRGARLGGPNDHDRVKLDKKKLEGYLQELDSVLADHPQGTGMVAMSVPWGPTGKLELGSDMLQAVKNRFHDKVRIFIGTGSFRREGRAVPENIQNVRDKILVHADVVSMNEVELDDLHTQLVGEGVHRDISLANKLKDLPLVAIKVCHSADGAILDLGCDPERIVSSRQFEKDPHVFLQETLQLSVDGATYAIDDLAKVGSKANMSMIRVYSGSVRERTQELFRTTFQKTVERLPGGIVAASAPLVLQRRAPMTGAGAMFDGLLASFLMRD